MEVKDLSSLSIFPLCLHTDLGTNYSYISNPIMTKIKDKNNSSEKQPKNKFLLKCTSNPKEKIQIFYAVIPAYVPIPPGMLVFTAKNSTTIPKYTISVLQERDPNVINLDGNVSFIAWPSIIPYTVPLFLHRMGKIVYPSFDKNTPSNLKYEKNNFDMNNIWTDEIVSPIYVIPETVIVNGQKIPGHKLNFDCYHDSRCILSASGTSLLNCLNRCTEVALPENIFHYINRVFLSKKVKSEKDNTIIKNIKKIPNYIIVIIMTIFFMFLGVFILIEISRNNRKGNLKLKN